MVFGQAHAQLIGDFKVGRLTTKTVFNGLDGLGDSAGVPVHRAWYPVALADLIHHGTPDPDAGVGLKGGAAGGAVSLGSFQEPDHAGLHQVFQLYRSWQPRHQVQGDFLHQRRMLFHKLGGPLGARLVVDTEVVRQCHVSGVV